MAAREWIQNEVIQVIRWKQGRDLPSKQRELVEKLGKLIELGAEHCELVTAMAKLRNQNSMDRSVMLRRDKMKAGKFQRALADYDMPEVMAYLFAGEIYMATQMNQTGSPFGLVYK